MVKTVKSKKKYTEIEALDYHSIVVTCACGAAFQAGSTQSELHVDICSNCHPFFTGESRIVDVEGRVDKFLKKYNIAKTQ